MFLLHMKIFIMYVVIIIFINMEASLFFRLVKIFFMMINDKISSIVRNKMT